MAASLLKIKLTVAFDGTAYAGWQVQTSGTGVQELIEKALSGLVQGEHRLHSSSRTDAGVHAEAMVAHVEIPKDRLRMPVRRLPLALNANLPEDIRVIRAQRMPSTFHARFDATGKQYRYRIWNHFAMNPLLRRYAWHVPQKLDLEAMRQTARLLVGKHDFRSFAANHSYRIEDTVRTLTRVAIQRKGPQWIIVIEGDGFLYKMCRGIVGTLAQVGMGRFTSADVQRMLEAKDRRTAGMSAPACGLVLCKVFYGAKKRGEHGDPR